MNSYVQAVTATDLREKLDADLRSITRKKEVSDTQWNERAQLRAFLKRVADEDFMGYPLEIFHTSESTPDFRLASPGHSIGIEASRITNEALHRLEALRNLGKTSDVVSISPMLVNAGRMNNDELLAAAAAGDSWNAYSSEEAFWLDRTRNIIDKKTEIRRRADYHDCGQNWLLLWDRLSITEEEAHARARLLNRTLVSYWTEDKVFNRIILECEELRRFIILSREGIHLFNG